MFKESPYFLEASKNDIDPPTPPPSNKVLRQVQTDFSSGKSGLQEVATEAVGWLEVRTSRAAGGGG